MKYISSIISFPDSVRAEKVHVQDPNCNYSVKCKLCTKNNTLELAYVMSYLRH